MAPFATEGMPLASAVQENLDASNAALRSSHSMHFHHLVSAIAHNLQYEHRWTRLTIHTHSTITGLPLLRPVISGLPPARAYIHPDEQIAVLKAEHDTGKKIEQRPELEWVLPTHLQEKFSLAKFSEVFDALDTIPPSEEGHGAEDGENVMGQHWYGKNRQKRLLLSTLHDDSTVAYYIVHDGIVKPRQN